MKDRDVVTVVVITLLAIFLIPTLTMGGMMMGGPVGGFGLLFLVGVVVLAYYLLTSREGEESEEEALKILRERYARGELSSEEYREMREKLKNE